MKLKVNENKSYSIITILANNEQPASGNNPIHCSEYQAVDFPESNGKLLVVSGMPMSASNLVSLHYKNLFGAIAIANPRNGVAEIVHSVSPDYKVGTTIPLE